MRRLLIALDWNGTVFDDTLPWAKAYNAALCVLGVDEQPLEELQDKYDTPIIHGLLNFGVCPNLYEQRAHDLYRAFKTVLDIEAAQAQLRDGAHDFLADMGDQENSVFLLSNHPVDMLTQELDRLGLRESFKHVSGRATFEEIRSKTTKIERLFAHMQENDIPAEDVVVIGDAREEARIARIHGMTSICITGGYSSRARLVEEGAHHIVDHLREIVPITAALKIKRAQDRRLSLRS